MEMLTAAIVLAWLVLVVLAFAMAGLLRQLRDVQTTLTRLDIGQAATAEPQSRLPESVRPQEGKAYATLLLVDRSCPICVEIAPLFARLASAGPADIDFVIVAPSAAEKWDSLEGVRTISDPRVYHRLDPGWQPAIIVVDSKGVVLASEPAGSEASVRAVVENIAGSLLAGS